MVEILANSLSCDLYGNHENLALKNLEVYIMVRRPPLHY